MIVRWKILISCQRNQGNLDVYGLLQSLNDWLTNIGGELRRRSAVRRKLL